MAIGILCEKCGKKYRFSGFTETHHKEEWIPVEMCWICRRQPYLRYFFNSILVTLFCFFILPQLLEEGSLFGQVAMYFSPLMTLYTVFLLIFGAGSNKNPIRKLPPAYIPEKTYFFTSMRNKSQ